MLKKIVKPEKWSKIYENVKISDFVKRYDGVWVKVFLGRKSSF